MTLEDETGTLNVIIWPSVLEKFRKEFLGALLIGIYGQWQADGDVKHLIAQRAVDLSMMLGALETDRFQRNYLAKSRARLPLRGRTGLACFRSPHP